VSDDEDVDRFRKRSRRAVNQFSLIFFALLAVSGPWLPAVENGIGLLLLALLAAYLLGALIYLLSGAFSGG
jgi:hypothetical protein